MPVDYAEAFRAGCQQSPRAAVERTEVEDVVSAMCKAASDEAAKYYKLPDDRGPALAFVHLTYADERARYASAKQPCAIPEGHARVYLMHGEWDLGHDVPAQHGIELLTYRRGPMGYPAKVLAFDGADYHCTSRTSIEAALANILRSPHTGARIRKAAKDFATRPTEP